jgi:hypothetical protein
MKYTLIALIIAIYMAGLSACGAQEQPSYEQVSQNQPPQEQVSQDQLVLQAVSFPDMITLSAEHLIGSTYFEVIFADEMGVMLSGGGVGPFTAIRATRDMNALPLYSTGYTNEGDAMYTMGWRNIAFDDAHLHFYIPLIYHTADGVTSQKIARMRTFYQYRDADFHVLHGQTRDHLGHTPQFIMTIGHMGYVNLFVCGDNLIVFDIHALDGYIRYTVTRLGTHGESVVLEKVYSMLNGNGYAMSDIFVSGGYIYSHVLRVEDYATTARYIMQHTMQGRLVKQFVLNIGDFLLMDEVQDTDSIEEIVVFGDFFVLTTRHDRAIVLRRNGVDLANIHVSESLLRMDGGVLLGAYHHNMDALYFWDSDSTVYVLTKPGEVHAIALHADGHISRILKCKSGNLLVQVQTDTGASLLYWYNLRD